MKVIYVNGLKIHDIADATLKFFVLQPIDGLDMAQDRTQVFDRSGEDGVYIPQQFLGQRPITMRGKINSVASESDLVTQRRALIAACAPEKDANGQLVQKILRFTAMDNVEYRVTGQTRRPIMPIANIRNSSFILTFEADTPYVETFTAVTTNINVLSGGGFTLPVTLPIVFDAGIGGSATVTNNGDAPAFPVITLTGPLTNPRIINTTLGRYIELNYTLPAGQTIEIDMLNKTIIQGGVTNRLSKKTDDSQWWWLDPGANVIQLRTNSVGESGTATVVHRHTYYGV